MAGSEEEPEAEGAVEEKEEKLLAGSDTVTGDDLSKKLLPCALPMLPNREGEEEEVLGGVVSDAALRGGGATLMVIFEPPSMVLSPSFSFSFPRFVNRRFGLESVLFLLLLPLFCCIEW